MTATSNTIGGAATAITVPLPVASTIDAVADYLAIYTASANATQRINRNTLLGISGAPVGTTDAQTLSGKVISGSNNTISNIAESSVTNLTTDLGNRLQLGGDVNAGTASAPQVTGLHLAGDTAVNHKLTNVTNPTSAQDAATKSYVDSALQAAYPVGSIFMSTVATNPATLFGFGTWAAYAAGRVPIGVGTSDQAFAAAATGGESNHTLITAEMPSHNHTPLTAASGTAGGNFNVVGNNGSGVNIATLLGETNAGGGGAHNNLPPYVVCYMWQRTA